MRDNVIGTYLHGPVLAKSARFADDLLRRALRRRGMDDELNRSTTRWPTAPPRWRSAGHVDAYRPNWCRRARGGHGTACTVNSGAGTDPINGARHTQVRTITAPREHHRAGRATFTPKPARTVAPLLPGAAPATGRSRRRARTSPRRRTEDPTVDVADIDGEPRLPHDQCSRRPSRSAAASTSTRRRIRRSPTSSRAAFENATDALQRDGAHRARPGNAGQGRKNLIPGRGRRALPHQVLRPGRRRLTGPASSRPARRWSSSTPNAPTPR